jgi:hypothetical protein
MKFLQFLQGVNGEFSSSRLLTVIFTCQFLYESHLILKVDSSHYITFCFTTASIILVLVGKMSAENITSIFKDNGRRDTNNIDNQ